MPEDDPSAPERNERLARLGREWFAEVRRRNADENRKRKADAPGSDADGGLWDWLFGDGGDQDCAGDGGEAGGDGD